MPSAMHAPSPAIVVVHYLTDNLAFPDYTGPVTLWGGLANPVPPTVNSSYWVTLYKRADESVRRRARQELRAADPGLKGKRLEARLDQHCQDARADANRTTWSLALEFLIFDLVCVAEGDFSKTGGRVLSDNRVREHALKMTRELLTYQFFDFVKSKVGVTIVPREFLSAEDLAPVDGKPQWHGMGEWVTTLDLA